MSKTRVEMEPRGLSSTSPSSDSHDREPMEVIESADPSEKEDLEVMGITTKIGSVVLEIRERPSVPEPRTAIVKSLSFYKPISQPFEAIPRKVQDTAKEDNSASKRMALE